jgi:hypothetical protein
MAVAGMFSVVFNHDRPSVQRARFWRAILNLLRQIVWNEERPVINVDPLPLKHYGVI